MVDKPITSEAAKGAVSEQNTAMAKTNEVKSNRLGITATKVLKVGANVRILAQVGKDPSKIAGRLPKFHPKHGAVNAREIDALVKAGSKAALQFVYGGAKQSAVTFQYFNDNKRDFFGVDEENMTAEQKQTLEGLNILFPPVEKEEAPLMGDLAAIDIRPEPAALVQSTSEPSK